MLQKKKVDAICIKEEEGRGEELKDTPEYNGNKASNLLVNNKGNEKGIEFNDTTNFKESNKTTNLLVNNKGNEKGEELKNKKGNNLNHSINDYERIKTLGKGAFGTVFLVRLKSDEKKTLQ